MSAKLLTTEDANPSDHARMRKLVSHAFSETALREQEPILTQYFDLLLSRLKGHLGGPTHGKVDIMSWYNFTTFDIIGLVDIIFLILTARISLTSSQRSSPWECFSGAR